LIRQVKQGTATAGVKRHYLGCVGKVANGITTFTVVCARAYRACADRRRRWILREYLDDPVIPLVMGLPDDLVFRTKGQLAIARGCRASTVSWRHRCWRRRCR